MPGPGADSFGDEERAEVLDVLASGHLSRYGDLNDPNFKHKVYDLELAFADFCGAAYALATNSGTSALLSALVALGVGSGDEVLVPGFTYVATYAAILQVGATPVLVEIDDSLTIDPVDLELKVTPRSKIVIVVHMLGAPCDMAAIATTARRHSLIVLEDACQAAGASYRGQRVGSLGDAAAFSFNRYKMIAAGEGGMLTTRTRDIHERAFGFHDQGHVPLWSSKKAPKEGFVGLNLKMNELTGAVVLAQLRKADSMIARLRHNKRRMAELILPLDGVCLVRGNYPEGECGTFLTVLFDDPLRAASVAAALGTTTMSETGWHNYRLMGHRRRHASAHCMPAGRDPATRRHVAFERWSDAARFAEPGALPLTDNYLLRAVSISVGVVDRGLGAAYGAHINSDDEAVKAAAEGFVSAATTTVCW